MRYPVSTVDETVAYSTLHCTVNYIDSTYTADEAHKRYYPTHTDRLQSLKNEFDPSRVFNFPQDF